MTCSSALPPGDRSYAPFSPRAFVGMARHAGAMEYQGDAVLGDDVELPAEPDVANAPAALNPLAVVSVVLGFLWLFWVGSLMAIAFGHVAKRQIDDSNGR